MLFAYFNVTLGWETIKKKNLLRYHSSGKENAATHLKRTSVTETFSKGGVHGL